MKYFELNSDLNPLLDRACPRGEARMWLALIEPDEPGQDKLVFDCEGCGQEESVVVRFDNGPRPPAAARRSGAPEWIGIARRTH